MLRGPGATVTLRGAEVRALAEWSLAARAAGFARVTAAPGPAGIEPDALDALMAAGIAGVRARLYAAEAGAHDHHAGSAGSFRATVALLRAARARRLPVVVTTPLTRSNARVLAALPGLLVDVAAIGWCVQVPATEAAAVTRSPGAVMPRLGVALPYALQAMTAAGRAGVVTAIAGAPLCLLGPLRERSVPGPSRAYAACCDGCGLRAQCVGIDAAYLERVGAGELAPQVEGAGARATSTVDDGTRSSASASSSTSQRDGGSEAASFTDLRAQRLQDMFSGPCLEVSEGACWPI